MGNVSPIEAIWIALSAAGLAFFTWDTASAISDYRHSRREHPNDEGTRLVAGFIVAYRGFTVYLELFMLAVGILAALAPETPASADPRAVIGAWVLRIGAIGIVAGLLGFGVGARYVRVRLGRIALLR